MPWPQRVFNSKHPATPARCGKTAREDRAPFQRARTERAGAQAHDVPMIGIPAAYATELQTVISALGDMKQSERPLASCGHAAMSASSFPTP